MTITIETIIHCDGDECPMKGVPLGNADSRGRHAWFQLQGTGWLSVRGQHYCPDCRIDATPAGKDTR